MLDLSGKTILAAGTGSGIGAAAATLLAARGATLAVADLDVTRAAQVAETIVAAGGRASAHRYDQADEALIAALVAAV